MCRIFEGAVWRPEGAVGWQGCGADVDFSSAKTTGLTYCWLLGILGTKDAESSSSAVTICGVCLSTVFGILGQPRNASLAAGFGHIL